MQANAAGVDPAGALPAA